MANFRIADDSGVGGVCSALYHLPREMPTTLVHTLSGCMPEAEAREQLKPGYNRFLAENDPALKNEAGQDLIRAIFGTDAIAEDAVR